MAAWRALVDAAATVVRSERHPVAVVDEHLELGFPPARAGRTFALVLDSRPGQFERMHSGHDRADRAGSVVLLAPQFDPGRHQGRDPVDAQGTEPGAARSSPLRQTPG